MVGSAARRAPIAHSAFPPNGSSLVYRLLRFRRRSPRFLYVSDFLDWVGDNAWAIWLGLALICGIVETVTLDLVFIMLAGGALAGAIASLIGAPFVLSALVAIIASAALLGVVRPVARRHLQTPFATRTGVAALVGSRGVVIERVDPDGGLIKLGGEVWTARPYDGIQVIDIGQPVDVVEIRGATALVFPAEAL
jgi:membrane protein implicated in regulation of membrane protease activity